MCSRGPFTNFGMVLLIFIIQLIESILLGLLRTLTAKACGGFRILDGNILNIIWKLIQ